jgi:hypothetical protein
MVTQVNNAGYQSYAYQAPAGGANEAQQALSAKSNAVQPREAPLAGTQNQAPREDASKNEQRPSSAPANESRGGKVNVTA